LYPHSNVAITFGRNFQIRNDLAKIVVDNL
jgi:hypothetical protein